MQFCDGLRSLWIEIFKTLNNVNPAFIYEIFDLKETARAVRNQYKVNLEVPIINQVTFGAKVLDILGQKFHISHKVEWKSYNF